MRSLSISTSAFLPTPDGAATRSRSGTPSRRATSAQAPRETAWARSLVSRPAPQLSKRGKMCAEIAKLRTTSPRNARRSYESVRRSTHDECVKACRARSSGSSSRREWRVSSASGALRDVRGHEVSDLAHGVQLGGLVVGDADAIGVLELDNQLDEVQGVGVEVLLEPCVFVDGRSVDRELDCQVIPHPREHLVPRHDPLPTLTAGADTDASEPLSRRAASVRSTTLSSTAR